MGRLGWILTALGGAAALGGIAYLATGGAAQPVLNKGPAPGGTPATTFDVILSPGNMTAIGLSLSGDNAASFTTPTGSPASINLLSNDSTTVQTSGMTTQGSATATAKKAGSVTLQAAWTDASGNAQSSTIPVTVTA